MPDERRSRLKIVFTTVRADDRFTQLVRGAKVKHEVGFVREYLVAELAHHLQAEAQHQLINKCLASQLVAVRFLTSWRLISYNNNLTLLFRVTAVYYGKMPETCTVRTINE